MRTYPIKRGGLPFVLALLYISGPPPSLSLIQTNSYSMKQVQFTQSPEAGLSISSAGFIDSTGKLVESTYFRQTLSIDGLRKQAFGGKT